MHITNTGAEAGAPIGWSDKPKDDPKVLELKAHLEASNGIKGLQILGPNDVDEAVRLFKRDGFVVIGDVLNSEEIDLLASGCNDVINEVAVLDPDNHGNRGSHRYSFGGSSLTRSQLHRPAWQMLLDVPVLSKILTSIFGSTDYILRAASGDFCLPGAVDYQPLHSDVNDWLAGGKTPFSSFFDWRGEVSLRDLPVPYICANFLPQDVTPLNGATRQIPGTQNSRAKIPNLNEEPEWMKLSTVCPAPAGAMMLRDVRAWHGGTPNLSDATRAIPNLEFYAPWFREPLVPGISYQDYKKLSAQAQRLVRFSVMDSSEELVTGATLRAP
ncbi:MAG: phytanoyl-CoA dioxygenase family protein [Pseudomonadales bacterium]|nr:phytanoyl-CoA dioxygenase family protein [Pseudomonadales bacterium]